MNKSNLLVELAPSNARFGRPLSSSNESVDLSWSIKRVKPIVRALARDNESFSQIDFNIRQIAGIIAILPADVRNATCFWLSNQLPEHKTKWFLSLAAVAMLAGASVKTEESCIK